MRPPKPGSPSLFQQLLQRTGLPRSKAHPQAAGREPTPPIGASRGWGYRRDRLASLDLCPACRGTGKRLSITANMQACPKCRGAGSLRVILANPRQIRVRKGRGESQKASRRTR